MKCRDGLTECPEPRNCREDELLCDDDPGVRGAIAVARAKLADAKERNGEA